MKFFEVHGKKMLAAAGILFLLLAAAGCSEAEKFSWERLKETHYRMITGKTSKPKAKPAAESEGQAAVSGQVNQDSQEVVADSKVQVETQSKVDVVLYFADQGGDLLVPEKREIVMVPGLARATVEELINGPKDKGLARTVPEGTKLRDINIEKGLCRVDFSRELKDNHWGGSSGELLTVYSIVDTLTQFPTVKEVEILIEGQKIDSLAGHMDLSVPVTRNNQVIKSVK